MFCSSDPIDFTLFTLVRVHCACANSSQPIRGLLSASLSALLLAYTDVSGDFHYKNPKEGTLGFLVVPNKSAMR